MFSNSESELINENESENESLNFQNNFNFLFPITKPQHLDLDNSNDINDINVKFNIVPSYYLIDPEKMEMKNIPNFTKSTAAKTNQKKEENDEPKLCDSNDILNIFNKQSNKDKISDDFKLLKFSKNIGDDLQLTRTKRKIDYVEYIDSLSINNKDNKNKKKKRGRKKENENKVYNIHDKMCSDNIIKKVKSAIFNYILFFLNNILSSADETCSLYNIKLSRLNYKYVDELKKEKELEILNMTLKEIFSKDISPKIKKFNSNFNKQIIENILNNKNKKVDNTVLFVFNMTLRNWLDIFTLKKSVIDIINEYKDKNYKDIDSEKIEKSMVGVDKLLNEIKEKNDEDYLPRFIFCLYNYERWFYLKKTRNKKKRTIN